MKMRLAEKDGSDDSNSANYEFQKNSLQSTGVIEDGNNLSILTYKAGGHRHLNPIQNKKSVKKTPTLNKLATQVPLQELKTPAGAKLLEDLQSMHYLPTSDSKPQSVNYMAEVVSSAPQQQTSGLASNQRNSVSSKKLDSILLNKRTGLFDVDSSMMVDGAY